MKTALLILMLPLACFGQHPLLSGSGIDWTTAASGDIIDSASLWAWYKPENLTNKYVNAQNITNWVDASGNGNDATNVTSGNFNCPTNLTGMINGYPSAWFDDAGLSVTKFQQLCNKTAWTISGWTGAEVYVVMRIRAKTSDGLSPSWVDYWGEIPVGLQHFIAYNSNPNQWSDGIWVNAGARVVNSSSSMTNVWHVYHTSTFTGNLTCWLDGSQVYTSGSSIVFHNSPDVGVGTAFPLGNHETGDAPFLGDIAEARFYKRILTSAERTTIDTLLRAKYGTP